MKQHCHQKLIAGRYYHIYNRGINSESIFKETINYYYFLSLWWKYTDSVAETYCYNLLPNHFHFFIRIRDSTDFRQASKAFSNLFNAYAKAVNKKYLRTGSLFQERFKRKEISDDSYFTKIICYIITNASKHGYCNNSLTYEYSAYHELVSNEPTRLMRDEIFTWFYDKQTFMQVIKIYSGGLRPVRS
jgi:REP element-mobilizing transposase RayT